MNKREEIDDLAEQIYHARFIHIQPLIIEDEFLEKNINSQYHIYI